MLDKLHKAASTYSPYNINVFNELFYRFAEANLIDDLPDILAKLDLFNEALCKKIVSVADSKGIRVKELASGRSMDRWKTFMVEDGEYEWKVTLTDFDKSLLPDLETVDSADNFKFATETCNLLDSFSELGNIEKYDVMLSSYTFDNLWFEGDFHLTKIDGNWYQTLYKLDLSKVEGCFNEMKQGRKLDKEFFKGLGIRMKKERINLSLIKYGLQIDKYFKDNDHVSVNFPGGLVSTTVSSFDNQLTKQGIFMTADIATVSECRKARNFESVNETIKIKVEDYGLAKFVLEKLGYEVELKDLHDFIKDSGIITPVPVYDHFVLLVRR